MTNDPRARAVSLRQQGMTYEEIADELGVTYTAAYRWAWSAGDRS